MNSPSSRRWIWFFVLLVLPLPFVITVPIWYNLRQQLDPERLEAARQRWREKGPSDYVLEYAIRKEYNPDPAGRAPDRFRVKVRAGQAVEVTGASDGRFATMDELFAFLQEQLEEDIAAGGRRPFMVAAFGKEDGHIARYRRSVLKTRELFEVEVKIRREE